MKTAIQPISVGTREASKLTGIPARTLRQWTKEGKVPAARRLGNKSYTYVIDELREMIVNAPKVEAH